MFMAVYSSLTQQAGNVLNSAQPTNASTWLNHYWLREECVWTTALQLRKYVNQSVKAPYRHRPQSCWSDFTLVANAFLQVLSFCTVSLVKWSINVLLCKCQSYMYIVYHNSRRLSIWTGFNYKYNTNLELWNCCLCTYKFPMIKELCLFQTDNTSVLR